MKNIFKCLAWVMFFLPLLGGGGAFAQVNLVPNPSFEDTIACPISLGGVGANPHLSCANWYNPTNTSPDYMNACAPHLSGGNMNVPNNYPPFGWQYARTGVAYVHIGTYSNTWREYVQVELTDTMISQHKYCLKFYVNMDNENNAASNNMGMYVSDVAITFPSFTSYFGLIPQLLDTDIVTDTVNWVEISGEYIASGGEQFITIGNFYLDNQTDTVNFGNGCCTIGYYIDDVSVIDCTGMTEGITEPIQEGEISIYPNPNNGEFTIRSKNGSEERVKVYTIMGELIKEMKMENGKCEVDMKTEAQGMYFVEVILAGSITQGERTTLRKKFVKE